MSDTHAAPALDASLPTPETETAKALIYAHNAIGSNLAGTQQISASVYALTELLIAKGVIGLQELEERKESINKRMMAQMQEKWLGARMLADETNKYDARTEVAIDCEARIPLCKASCCKLSFYLSRQDLEEGVVRWEFGRPYHIAHNAEGYCVHCDDATKKCSVRANRPLTCRTYDCRQDKRIWADFENRIPNPNLAKLEAPAEPTQTAG
jgi:Fe-S-cluster containining protein